MEIFGDYITLTKDTHIRVDGDSIILYRDSEVIYQWNREELSELIDALIAFYELGDFTKDIMVNRNEHS